MDGLSSSILLPWSDHVPTSRTHTAPTAPRRRYVSMNEAAEYLGVTDRTIRAMVSSGRLTAYRNGPKLVRLDLNEIDAAMQPYGGRVHE